MILLRWMCAVAKMDRIRNERIRVTTIVRSIMQDIQLKWYGYVMRRDEEEYRVGNESLGWM